MGSVRIEAQARGLLAGVLEEAGAEAVMAATAGEFEVRALMALL